MVCQVTVIMAMSSCPILFGNRSISASTGAILSVFIMADEFKKNYLSEGRGLITWALGYSYIVRLLVNLVWNETTKLVYQTL